MTVDEREKWMRAESRRPEDNNVIIPVKEAGGGAKAIEVVKSDYILDTA